MRPSLFRDVRNGILDLVYPRLCPGCDAPLPHREQPQLCASCEDRLHPLTPPFCPICGEKFHAKEIIKGRPCRNCDGRNLAFDFAIAPYHAHDLLRDLIHQLKYQKARHLLPLLSHLAGTIRTDPRIRAESAWTVVPVPLHPSRQRRRGFNQATEIGKRLAQTSGWRFLDALKRTRAVKPQADLDRADRLLNVRGAFSLSSEDMASLLQNTPILLVDDVLTTGSTAHECAKVLKDGSSVSKVAVVTLSRGGRPGLG
ncbi:MAG: ComF family protein [Verrucomicrobiota bacterium]